MAEGRESGYRPDVDISTAEFGVLVSEMKRGQRSESDVAIIKSRIDELSARAVHELGAENVLQGIVNSAVGKLSGRKNLDAAMVADSLRKAVSSESARQVQYMHMPDGTTPLSTVDARLALAYMNFQSEKMADLVWAQMNLVDTIRIGEKPSAPILAAIQRNMPQIDSAGRVTGGVDLSKSESLGRYSIDWQAALQTTDPIENISLQVQKKQTQEKAKQEEKKRGPYADIKFEDLQKRLDRLNVDSKADADMIRALRQEKRVRVDDFMAFIESRGVTEAQFVQEIDRRIRAALEGSYPVYMKPLERLTKERFSMVEIPDWDWAQKEFGGLQEQIFKDEAERALVEVGKVLNENKRGRDRTIVYDTREYEARQKKGHIDIGAIKNSAAVFVEHMPKTFQEVEQILRNVPASDQPGLREYLENAVRQREFVGQRADRQKMVDVVSQSLLKGAVNNQSRITLEDAYLIVAGERAALQNRVTRLMTDLWKTSDENRRRYAKSALTEMTQYVGSGEKVNRKDLVDLATEMNDSLIIYNRRTEYRNIGRADDPQGAAGRWQTDEETVNTFSTDTNGGQKRLERWFGTSLRFLQKLDGAKTNWPKKTASYWEDSFMTTDRKLEGGVVVSLSEINKQAEQIRNQAEPDLVKQSVEAGVLELWGVEAERARETFDSANYGNLSYLMNPVRYLERKRGKELRWSAYPQLAKKIYSPGSSTLEYDSPTMRKLNIPALIGSYPSYLLWSQGYLRGNDPCWTDFSKINVDKLQPAQGSYAEWLVFLSKATGTLKNIEEVVNTPTVENFAKQAAGGMSMLFSVYNRPEDGFDLSERKDEKGHTFMYGNRRNAILIELGLFVFSHEFNRKHEEVEEQKRKGKDNSIAFLNDIQIQQELLKSMEQSLIKSSSNLMTNEFMADFVRVLKYEGLYPSNMAQDFGDTAKAGLPFLKSIWKTLMGIFKQV